MEIHVSDPIPETEEDIRAIHSGSSGPKLGDSVEGTPDGEHVLIYNNRRFLITLKDGRIKTLVIAT